MVIRTVSSISPRYWKRGWSTIAPARTKYGGPLMTSDW